VRGQGDLRRWTTTVGDGQLRTILVSRETLTSALPRSVVQQGFPLTPRQRASAMRCAGDAAAMRSVFGLRIAGIVIRYPRSGQTSS